MSSSHKIKTAVTDAVIWIGLFPSIFRINGLLRDTSSIVDIGCGSRSPLRFLSLNAHKTGVDGYPPDVETAKTLKIHDEYIIADLRRLQLPSKSFDAVVCFDVIEHLDKESSSSLLSEFERLARKLIIVTTPNGFVPQVPADGNEYQNHLCGWTPTEMRELGYKVHGMYGAKRLRGHLGRIAKKPWLLWWCASKLSEVFVWNEPDRAFGLLCYKRLN